MLYTSSSSQEEPATSLRAGALVVYELASVKNIPDFIEEASERQVFSPRCMPVHVFVSFYVFTGGVGVAREKGRIKKSKKSKERRGKINKSVKYIDVREEHNFWKKNIFRVSSEFVCASTQQANTPIQCLR